MPIETRSFPAVIVVTRPTNTVFKYVIPVGVFTANEVDVAAKYRPL